MKWKETMDKEFPGVIAGPEFTKKVTDYLDNQEGFTAENTICGNSTCPDEFSSSA